MALYKEVVTTCARLNQVRRIPLRLQAFLLNPTLWLPQYTSVISQMRPCQLYPRLLGPPTISVAWLVLRTWEGQQHRGWVYQDGLSQAMGLGVHGTVPHSSPSLCWCRGAI